MKLTFDQEFVSFHNYPFPGSSIHPRGKVTAGSIRDVDPDAYPPEIRTRDGETLFVPRARQTDFQKFIGDQSLKVVQRPDVWSLILDPFLDTEFTAELQELTFERLAEFGLTRDQVQQTRDQVESAMLSYNQPFGEWRHLGLFDMLHAMRSTLTISSLIHRISPERYARFYWDAMQMAELG